MVVTSSCFRRSRCGHLLLLTSLFLFVPKQSQALSLLHRSRTSKDADAEAAAAAAKAAASSLSNGANNKMPVSSQLIHLALAAIIGFGMDPLVMGIFNVTYLEEENDKFRHTFLYGAADSLSTGARATGLVLLGSLLKDYLGVSIPFCANADLLTAAPQIGSVVWITMTLCTTKRTLLQRAVSGIKGLGRVGLYNRLLDVLLGMGAAGNIMKILGIDIGLGFQSLFAASGVSALVFSLASRGLVEQIASGIIIQAWDAIEEGDKIRLGDGTEGTVKMVGLVETVIVGGDDVAIRIPNTHITRQRISNLSDVTKSQYKQILRFKYSDLNRIPQVLDTIKQEIQANCPDLILDGSKPFRAVLTGYEPDHVQAEITTSFNLKPGSGQYIEAKQQVLLSIAKAVAAHDVQFAIPSIHYHSDGNGPEGSILFESNDASKHSERPPQRVPA